MPHLVSSQWAFDVEMIYRRRLRRIDVDTLFLRQVSAGLLANLFPKSDVKGKKLTVG